MSSSASRKVSVASRKLSNLMDREVMDAFSLFDRNKDGKITSEEIKELITSLGGDTQCTAVQVSSIEVTDELRKSNDSNCSISQELVRSAESQASVDVKRFMYLWKDFKAKKAAVIAEAKAARAKREGNHKVGVNCQVSIRSVCVGPGNAPDIYPSS